MNPPQIASPGQVHEHIGSACDEGELQVLKAAARQRLVAGQDELHLGLERTERLPGAVRAVAPLPITSSQMRYQSKSCANTTASVGSSWTAAVSHGRSGSRRSRTAGGSMAAVLA